MALGLRVCSLAIDHTKVGSGGVTDFSMLLTRANFPNEMCSPTDGNNAQADGGDIRFSSDAAGATRLPCDLIQWGHDTSDGAGDAVVQIRVLVPSISSASDTTIYVWYSSAGTESQPDADEAYGQYATYPDRLLFLPLEETPDAGVATDRVLGGIAGTVVAMESGDLQAAKVSNGYNFDGSAEYVKVPGNTSWEVPGGFTNTGLTYDESDDALWIGDFDSNRLVQVDFSGSATGLTVSITDAPQGVAYDSSDDTLWWSDFNNSYLRHVAKDGTVIESISLGFQPNGCSYSAADDSIWVIEDSTNNCKRYSCSSLTLQETVTIPSPATTPDGLHYEASDDSFWVTNDAGPYILHVDASTGTLLGYSLTTDYVEDIVLVRGNLWMCSDAYYHGSVANGNRVHRISRTILTGSSSFTISIWANVGTLSPTDCLFLHGRPITNEGWGIYFSSSTNIRTFVHDHTTGTYIDRTITTGSMSQYTVVFDRSGAEISVYQNGSLVSSAASISAVTGSMFNTKELIGVGAAAQSGDRFIAALADEVHVILGAKSAAWVLTDYNNTNSPSTFVTEGSPADAVTTIYQRALTGVGL